MIILFFVRIWREWNLYKNCFTSMKTQMFSPVASDISDIKHDFFCSGVIRRRPVWTGLRVRSRHRQHASSFSGNVSHSLPYTSYKQEFWLVHGTFGFFVMPYRSGDRQEYQISPNGRCHVVRFQPNITRFRRLPKFQIRYLKIYVAANYQVIMQMPGRNVAIKWFILGSLPMFCLLRCTQYS